MIVRYAISAVIGIAAVICWTIGELGTLGAFVPNNHGWASFHSIFLIPWVLSILLVWRLAQ